MTDEGRRYVDFAVELKALDSTTARYVEVTAAMERIWWQLGEPEREEIEGLLIAIDELERTGVGYPPANEES